MTATARKNKTRRRTKKLTASLEDYLEAILHLVQRGRVARVRDIAAHVGVGMSAVTAALKTLSKRGLVNYDPYQVITMTSRGRAAAERVTRRHRFLRRFLTDVLGLDEPTAEANACRLEHAVDEVLLERLHRFAEFVDSRTGGGDNMIGDFEAFCHAQRTLADE